MHQAIKTRWYLKYQDCETKFLFCSDSALDKLHMPIKPPSSFLIVKTGKLRHGKMSD